MGNHTNLIFLYLGNNDFSGEIPEEICNQGDSTPFLNGNHLCLPYPDCGDGPITSEDEQDTTDCTR